MPLSSLSNVLISFNQERAHSSSGRNLIPTMNNLFGGKDPFDDPFFTHPFGSLFGSHENFNNPSSKQVTIEELDSDGNPLKSGTSKQVSNNNNSNRTGRTDKRSYSYQRVSYGGRNGTYYTSSVTKKTGGDGVVFMEVNEDDKTIGEALHTVSRGIHDKGHSVTTKRSSDGKEDTLQTLHNMNQDELDGFEQNWKDNSGYLPDMNGGFKYLENAADMWPKWPGWGEFAQPGFGYGYGGGWALPPTAGYDKNADEVKDSTKKVVRINVD